MSLYLFFALLLICVARGEEIARGQWHGAVVEKTLKGPRKEKTAKWPKLRKRGRAREGENGKKAEKWENDKRAQKWGYMFLAVYALVVAG
jgi:hypothetical protein